MEVGFFHPTAGYWQAVNEPSPEVLATYPVGTRRVPLKPGEGYAYDGDSWIPPSQQWLDEKAAREVRLLRDFKLRSEVDPVVSNPLRWGDMTEAQRTAWANYRRALLDITSQSGFPHNVVWPTKP